MQRLRSLAKRVIFRKELRNQILFLKSNKEEDISQLLKQDTIFEKAINKYNYFTDNEDLLNEYDRKEAYLIYQDSLMKVAEKDGFDEGIKRQKRRENCRTNLNGKINEKENIDIELIKKITGLTIN